MASKKCCSFSNFCVYATGILSLILSIGSIVKSELSFREEERAFLVQQVHYWYQAYTIIYVVIITTGLAGWYQWSCIRVEREELSESNVDIEEGEIYSYNVDNPMICNRHREIMIMMEANESSQTIRHAEMMRVFKGILTKLR
ncbi:unnamed protein product [Pylaiella littoralis]